ncbi:MAG: hypothetical protein ACKVOU_05480 [Cytophagales bacterium]
MRIVNNVVQILSFLVLVLMCQLAQSQPVISNVEPKVVSLSQVITVAGSQLSGVTQVKLNARSLSLASIIKESDNTVLLKIPANIQHGVYNLSFNTGTLLGNSFEITILGPAITAISPQNQEIDKRITIFTSNVDSIISLKFGNTMADLSSMVLINGKNEFSITVPFANIIGSYPVVINTEYDFTPAFPFSISGLNIPQIVDIQPIEATEGAIITITGTNIDSITGITFGNTLVSLSSISKINLQKYEVIVPFLGLGQNDVKVYTKRGESEAFGFQKQIAIPTFSTFFPTQAKIGEFITVIGTNLNASNAIVIGEITTTGINFLSVNSLRFVVPNDAVSNTISIISPNGNLQSSDTLQIDTVTSIRSNTIYFDESDTQIMILGASNDLLKLYLKNDYNVLIINDILGKQIYRLEHVLKGILEIPLSFSGGNYFIFAQNNVRVDRIKVFLSQ